MMVDMLELQKIAVVGMIVIKIGNVGSGSQEKKNEFEVGVEVDGIVDGML